MSKFEKFCMGALCFSASLFFIVFAIVLALKVFRGC